MYLNDYDVIQETYLNSFRKHPDTYGGEQSE